MRLYRKQYLGEKVRPGLAVFEDARSGPYVFCYLAIPIWIMPTMMYSSGDYPPSRVKLKGKRIILFAIGLQSKEKRWWEREITTRIFSVSLGKQETIYVEHA